MRSKAFLSVLKTIWYALSGRIHFPKNRVGEVLTMEDGGKFVIYRQAIVSPGKNQPEKPGAIFRIRIHLLEKVSFKQDRIGSLFAIPLFVGLPGFRSKLWTTDEVNRIAQGIYEWDTIQDAENYINALALKIMAKQATPGSVSREIVPTKAQ